MTNTVNFLLAASAAFLLVGCSQDVTNGDVYTASKFCEDKGGLNHIHYDDLSDTIKVFCQNGDMNTMWSIIKQRHLDSSRSIL